jgi:ABC-type dipeptide/oligopeptide/nickel transport system ATPase component
MAPGCAFAPRCTRVLDRCRSLEPPQTNMGDGRQVRCWLSAAGAADGADKLQSGAA